MKQTILIILVLGILSCNSTDKKKQLQNANDSTATGLIRNPDFKKYIESLDQIPLPLNHSSIGKFSKLSEKYDKQGFEKYKHVWTSQPLGLLYKTDKYFVTVDLSIGDIGLAPFLTSYDLDGNKLDSLGPYKKSGWDMGYEAVEYVTFNSNLTVLVADTVKRWKLNEDETDIVEDSVTVTIDTVIYRLSDKGKFLTE